MGINLSFGKIIRSCCDNPALLINKENLEHCCPILVVQKTAEDLTEKFEVGNSNLIFNILENPLTCLILVIFLH